MFLVSLFSQCCQPQVDVFHFLTRSRQGSELPKLPESDKNELRLLFQCCIFILRQRQHITMHFNTQRDCLLKYKQKLFFYAIFYYRLHPLPPDFQTYGTVCSVSINLKQCRGIPVAVFISGTELERKGISVLF